MTLSDSSAESLELDRLITEYFDLQAEGRAPSVEAFIAEHAEYEHGLRAVLPGASVLDQLGRRAQDAAEPIGRSGERIGEFRLLGILGRGGMGVVYDAVQESLGRPVALKVLPASRVLDRKSRERFLREAQAAASLHHPSIVPVHGVGEAEGQVYYAMQRIDGVPLDLLCAAAEGVEPSSDSSASIARAVALAERMRSGVLGPLKSGDGLRAVGGHPDSSSSGDARAATIGGGRPWIRNAARIALHAAEAVAYAHSRGVLHRDIKPSNVMIDEAGRVYLTDFGLCKTGDNSSITAAGDVVGTLRYVPPERFQGRDDARGDVYGIGMILYELLTGRPAFPQEDRAALVQAVTLHAPPRPRKLNREIPRDLEGIVLRAIAQLPVERYPSAEDLIADLAAFLEGRATVARAPGKLYLLRLFVRRNRALVATAAAALVAIAAATLFYLSSLRGLVSRLDATNSQLEQAVYAAEITGAAHLINDDKAYLARPMLAGVPEAERDWVWRNFTARAERASLVVGEGEAPIVDGDLEDTGRALAIVRGDRLVVHDASDGRELWGRAVEDLQRVALGAGGDVALIVAGPDRIPELAVRPGAEPASRALAEGLAGLALSGVDDVDAHGRFLALGCMDGRVVVLDTEAPGRPRVFRHVGAVRARIALVGRDGAVVRFTRDGEGALFGPEPRRSRPVALPDGPAVRAVDGAADADVFHVLAQGTVLRYAVGEGAGPLLDEHRISVANGSFRLATSPDGAGFLTVTPRGLGRVWDVERGRGVRSERLIASPASFLEWAPASGDLVIGGEGGTWSRMRRPDHDLGGPGISRARAGFRMGGPIGFDGASRYFVAAETTGAWSVWTSERRLPVHAEVRDWTVIHDVAIASDFRGVSALALVGDGVRAHWRRPGAGEGVEPRRLELPEGVDDEVLHCMLLGPGAAPQLVALSVDGTILAARPGDAALRSIGRLPGRVRSAATVAAQSLLFAGLESGEVWRARIGSDAGEARRIATLSDVPVGIGVDRFGRGDSVAAVTRDGVITLLSASGSSGYRVRWEDRCIARGEAFTSSAAIALDEASGWVVLGSPDGQLRTWSVGRGRPGPVLLDVYSRFSDVEFPRPGEPPVAMEFAARLDHFEADPVDRSEGSPGVLPSAAEAAALETLSPRHRLGVLARELERGGLDAERLRAIRQQAYGLRLYGNSHPDAFDRTEAWRLEKEAERRLDDLARGAGS